MHHGQSRGEKIPRKVCKKLLNFSKTGGNNRKVGGNKKNSRIRGGNAVKQAKQGGNSKFVVDD